ncbi:copper-binding protein [Pelomonas sp. V22]|uniref:copper-binding protein n=1 Tax=Pelomonas sp. V22 TaxID=2822139 RepID=UPI0024A81802|nr:copper-binding protein [Pelomonas sp. V22]MDI4635228.1 copper-binding protein [Pelomonas sp. V22]
MNAIKTLTLASLIVAGASLAGTAAAQAMDHSKMHGTAASASAAEMTEGEIKKIDKDNKKLTIKHGDIRNLDMPGMTMVFQVKDPAMVDQVKVGDKVRFVVEKTASGFVVTELARAGK